MYISTYGQKISRYTKFLYYTCIGNEIVKLTLKLRGTSLPAAAPIMLRTMMMMLVMMMVMMVRMIVRKMVMMMMVMMMVMMFT
jgi:hypothetical protein